MVSWASAAAVYQLERRIRAAQAQELVTSAWQAFDDTKRSHMAVGATTGVAIIIGGSQDVTVNWPGNGFMRTDYEVDIIPTGLLGKGSWSVIAQDESTVTVRVTATVLITIGTQFLVYGYG
jgi:hypothetical protein